MIIDEDDLVTVALFKHKTSDIYASQLPTMNKIDSDIIQSYIAKHSLADLLFPEHAKSGKLSPFIKKMMTACHITGTGTNTMRHIIAGSFNKKATLSIQKKNARSMMHSLETELTSYR